MKIVVRPNIALMRYWVPCSVVALLAVGIVGVEVNSMVGVNILLFDTGMVVERAMDDVERLANVVELLEGVELIDGGEVDVGKLGDVAELVDDRVRLLVGDVELVVVALTKDNFSRPAVTV